MVKLDTSAKAATRYEGSHTNLTATAEPSGIVAEMTKPSSPAPRKRFQRRLLGGCANLRSLGFPRSFREKLGSPMFSSSEIKGGIAAGIAGLL